MYFGGIIDSFRDGRYIWIILIVSGMADTFGEILIVSGMADTFGEY